MPKQLRSVVYRAAPYVLIAVLCAIFFWRIWTPNANDRASFVHGDFSGQFYAFARYQSDRLWAGQLPLWDPYVASGQPFLADIQSASFYPPRLILIVLSGPKGFTYATLEFEAILHIFLAGVFTYAFARRLFEDDVAALVAALTFAFGGYLTSYPILQLAILETIVWLPLILLLIDRAFCASDRRAHAQATIAAGLVWGVALLAGHPQMAMHVAYTALLFGAWCAYRARLGWAATLIRLLAFAVIGIAAAAMQLLPSFEFMRQSTRDALGYDALAGGFPLRDVTQMLLPGTTSVWSPLYIGILPLVLVFVSIAKRQRRSMRFWLVLAAIAFVLSLGGGTFLFGVLYRWAPGFDLFRSQERLAGIFSFALAIAVAGGLMALRGDDANVLLKKTRRALIWLAAALILGAALLYVLWQLTGGPDVAFALDRAVFTLLIVLASIGLLVLRRSAFTDRMWWIGVLAIIVLDLFSINWQTVLEARSPEAQAQMPGFLDAIRADPEVFRVDARGYLDGNWGNLAELQSIDGVSPLMIGHYARMRDALPKEREWQLLNVKYVITTDQALALPAELIAQGNWEGNALNVFRLSSPVPRAWLVHRVQVVDDALDAQVSGIIDVLNEAIVSQPVTLSESAGTSAARVIEYQPERIVIDVDAAGDAVLVLSEIDYPGWRATIDSEDAPIVRADGMLRAVAVRSGSHQVEFVFQPASVTIGLLVSGVTWIAALLSMIVLQIGKRA